MAEISVMQIGLLSTPVTFLQWNIVDVDLVNDRAYKDEQKLNFGDFPVSISPGNIQAFTGDAFPLSPRVDAYVHFTFGCQCY